MGPKHFEYGVDQAAFDAAFGGISLSDAVALILGDKPLSPAQAECMHFATGDGCYRLSFAPRPVGHVGFLVVGSRGLGNYGWPILVPGTPECRRRVNAERRSRWASYLTKAYGLEFSLGLALFNECHGHVPTLNAASEMLAAVKDVKIKNLSNRAWRDMGFRPGHPYEGRALNALRKLGLA